MIISVNPSLNPKAYYVSSYADLKAVSSNIEMAGRKYFTVLIDDIVQTPELSAANVIVAGVLLPIGSIITPLANCNSNDVNILEALRNKYMEDYNKYMCYDEYHTQQVDEMISTIILTMMSKDTDFIFFFEGGTAGRYGRYDPCMIFIEALNLILYKKYGLYLLDYNASYGKRSIDVSKLNFNIELAKMHGTVDNVVVDSPFYRVQQKPQGIMF